MKASPLKEWETLEVAVPRDVFLSEIDHWAKTIEVEPREIRLRSMKRKWGSCSIKGILTFDSELLYQHAEFRKRVIVEELLHLRVPNHGKLFKSLLRSYLELDIPKVDIAKSFSLS